MRAIIAGATSGSSAVLPAKLWPLVTVSRFVPSRSISEQQPGLARGGQAEHRHDRGDADRDPQRGERRAHPPRAQPDARNAREIGGAQLLGGQIYRIGGEVPSRGHDDCPGASLTSANAAGLACSTRRLDDVAARQLVGGEGRCHGDPAGVRLDLDRVGMGQVGRSWWEP